MVRKRGHSHMISPNDFNLPLRLNYHAKKRCRERMALSCITTDCLVTYKDRSKTNLPDSHRLFLNYSPGLEPSSRCRPRPIFTSCNPQSAHRVPSPPLTHLPVQPTLPHLLPFSLG